MTHIHVSCVVWSGAVQKKVEEPVAAAEPVAEVVEAAVESPVSAEAVVGKKEGSGVSIAEETDRVIKIGDVEVDNSRDFKIEVDRDEGRVGQELRKKGGKGRKDSMTQEQQDDSRQQLENMRRQHEEAAAKRQQEAKHMERTRGKIPQQAVDPSKVSRPQIGGGGRRWAMGQDWRREGNGR